MAPIMSIVGGAIGGTMQSAAFRKQAAEQKKKAEEFSLKANQVVTEDVTNDPAFRMKEYLARNGMPGLTDGLNEIDQTIATNAGVAENASSSGGQLLSMLASLNAGGLDAKKDLLLNNQKALFETKNQLAHQQYQWQQQLDKLARDERASLNKVASQYQAAADLNQNEADQVDASTVANTFSSMGSMMGGGMGGGMFGMGGSTPSMKTDPNPTTTPTLSMSPNMMSPVDNVSLGQNEIGEMVNKLISSGQATDPTSALALLKSMGFNF